MTSRPPEELRASAPPRRPRIAITGSAGVGKSALAHRLAHRLEVPIIHERMRSRLEAGLDLHALGAGGLRALLLELFDEMVDASEQAMAVAGGFVSDRCALDVAAFWLYYGFGGDGDATERIVGRARAMLGVYDLVVLLPWGAIPLAADGVRSPNRWLQLHYQTVLEGLLRRWVPATALESIDASVTDIELRAEQVCRRLSARVPT